MYTFLVILHILSAGVWVSLGVVTIFLNSFRKRVAGTAGELYLMRALIMFGAIMGNIGGIGILITGGAMTGMVWHGWFDFGALPWLAAKQTIYVVLLIMTFAIMLPATKKARRSIGEEMAGLNPAGGASDVLRKQIDRLVAVGLFMQLLILTNIVLGEWGPTSMASLHIMP
jgi:hypothetical protein